MPTDAGTDPANVRVEIDTRLADGEIDDTSGDGNGILQRIEREWQREYDTTAFDGADHIQDFEAVLAALRIAEGRDRRGEEVQSGRTSTTYETAEVANLRKRLRRLDPGGAFGRSGSVVVDDDRHTSTTTDS